jgi:hypothetical protein
MDYFLTLSDVSPNCFIQLADIQLLVAHQRAIHPLFTPQNQTDVFFLMQVFTPPISPLRRNAFRVDLFSSSATIYLPGTATFFENPMS